ncbi:MAG: hypothetical protein VKS61_08415 [Candidatus Sericytochromatia bacterium]|nr:hypothetical protein [Candidatus Sericytochromatia bacterium]
MGHRQPGAVSALSLSYLDWPRLLDHVRERLRTLEAARWAMGDTLVEVQLAMGASPEIEAAFAREGCSWPALAASLGVRTTELATLREVARSFPPRKRVSGVGWEHHRRVLLTLPTATLSLRQRWLREAARRDWSAATLARRIRAEACAQGAEPRPRKRRLPGAAATPSEGQPRP